MDFSNKRVVVLGGAGFIGSHLVDRLINMNVKDLIIVDNFVSGKYVNIQNDVPVYQLDCRNFGNCVSALFRADLVFHLASNNGGRGYLETHATDLWNNIELDSTIFRACEYAGVDKVVFFSSSCVYPNYGIPFFDEGLVDYQKIEQADGAYGMEKLIGEHILNTYVDAGKFNGISIRPFNVYGPRMKENKAMTAFVARTFIKQSPFEVWGDGNQRLDWVYVGDLIDALILVVDKMNRGAINIGTGYAHTPMDALTEIWDYVGWVPGDIKFTNDRMGYSKIADIGKLQSLGWEPKTDLVRGIHNVVDWYYDTHKEEDVRENFERKLIEI